MHTLSQPRTIAASLTTALAALLLTADASAQQPIGSTYHTGMSVGSRGALLSSPGVLITRIDRDEVRGFGMDPSRPGKHVITGVQATLVDYEGTTPETYSVVLYGENALNPGFPNTQSPLATIGPFTLPASGAGLQTQVVTHLFATPVEAPVGGDLFVGVQLSTAPAWPSDGLAVGTLLAQVTRWPLYDLPGPTPIQHQGYGMFYRPSTQQLGYNTPRKLLIELLTATPGGTSTTITNQASFAASNAAPGTGSFFSGLHPDARSPSRNPGRADDVGYVYLDAAMPNGTAVFFLADFGNFGPEIFLSTLVPNSVGVLCLNGATAQNIGLSLLNNGEASLTIAIPATLRPSLAGTVLVRQAIALHPTTFGLRGSPCTKQVF